MNPSPGLGPLAALRILHTAGGTMFDQAVLHGQLARVEWMQEKQRLLTLLLLALLGFACLLCALMFAGVSLLLLSWDYGYRLHTALGLVAGFACAAFVTWRRFRVWMDRGDDSFSASREELAADAEVLRNNT